MSKLALQCLDQISKSISGTGDVYYELFESVSCQTQHIVETAEDSKLCSGVLFLVASPASSPITVVPPKVRVSTPLGKPSAEDESSSAFSPSSNNNSFAFADAHNRAVRRQDNPLSFDQPSERGNLSAILLWAPLSFLQLEFPRITPLLSSSGGTVPLSTSPPQSEKDLVVFRTSEVKSVTTPTGSPRGTVRVKMELSPQATSLDCTFTFHAGNVPRFFDALKNFRPDLVNETMLSPNKEGGPQSSSFGKVLRMFHGFKNYGRSAATEREPSGGAPPDAPLHSSPLAVYQGRVLGEEEGEAVRDPCPGWASATAEAVDFVCVMWQQCFDERGVLDGEKFQAFKTKFLGDTHLCPVPDSIRFAVWAYCLPVFPVSSTVEERNAILAENAELYAVLTSQWRSIVPEQEANFTLFRSNKDKIEKDVKRTDRGHPLLTEEDSSKLAAIRHVLLCHLLYNFDLGYIQGMSDLVSIIAVSTETEEECFLYYKALIQARFKHNFVLEKSKTDVTARLKQLHVLVRHFIPRLHSMLQQLQNEDMNFCFGLLITCFKRALKNDVHSVLWFWDYVVLCPPEIDFPLLVLFGLLREYARTDTLCHKYFSSDTKLIQFANNFTAPVNHLVAWGLRAYKDVCEAAVTLGGTGKEGAPAIAENGFLNGLPLSKAVQIIEKYDSMVA
ncbi:hypothetical protein AGDE_14873 [Angomonas deanei]|uniref:Rab-GTPase-TBC domain containing protein, putative n=1 Tax=Angomonas deanei TaxID=59799 RepID=A0A7G2CI45_9TRYP|nr:hypothetical protein AGDE_14873 [Angomonas deanei]CAD2218363.1 Rab-GTPase-TBC domain containing protein, putative [Angomonas deanei]|eukprot:EPY20067.1 hypothetical protein AGDE_14873 [Angomonas deanei]